MMQRPHATHLAVAALMAAVSAAACGDMQAPSEPAEARGSATATSASIGGEQSGLAAVRQATAAFHDVDKAIEAGYVSPAGGVCDASAAGTMGVHAANPALLQAPGFDMEKPEVLLYLPTAHGYRLVGVEYLVPVILRDTTANQIVGPWFESTPWPSTYVPVGTAPSLLGHTFQGPMAGHVPGMPWHYDLHVWIWETNPSGMFAQWNPSISCS